MKRILLFFLFSLFFLFTFQQRYQPVSLELVQPTTKEIELKGEIKNPGVYTVKYNATVEEAIRQAGGLNEKADTTSISLVREVLNHEVIVIGQKEESQKKISINSASLEELVTLPGIGESTAQKILEYRKNKSFSTLEEIMEIKGIKEGIYSKIKDYICL
ncbi:MAG: ComEA family DNA-binding protein [Firmicutes bacterium]|nr:ComEA family DNA-binding protein [Bacillota bacterium]